MKIVAMPIDTVVVFTKGRNPAPYKFKFINQEGQWEYVSVDKILETEKINFGGVPAILYRCPSKIKDRELRYELKYIIKEVRWELYKI